MKTPLMQIMLKKMLGFALALALANGLAGCGSLGKSYQQEFDRSFRAGFKEKFLASCADSAGHSARAKAYCTCTESRMEKQFSDSQMMELSQPTAAEKQTLSRIVKVCRLLATAKH